MAAEVEFIDLSIKVTQAMEDAALRFLEEAGFEIESAAKRNSRVDNGQLKGSWRHIVDDAAYTVTIGSPLANAVWEEFGTGEYALHGDGRKGGWSYQDDKGDWHHTHGKKPNRTLHNAFEDNKSKIVNRAKEIFKGMGS